MPLLLPRIPGRLPDGITRGLTSRWPLDDASIDNVVRDIVGGVRGDFLTDRPTGDSGPAGARSLLFGAGGLQNCINLPVSPITDLNSFSLSFWINLNSFTTPGGAGFAPRPFCAGTGAASTDGAMVVFNDPTASPNGALEFRAFGFSVSVTPLNTGAFPLSQWNHLVCTFNSFNVQAVYINGVSYSLGGGLGNAINPGFYSIGGRSAAGPVGERVIDGRMADVRVYNGTVLTAAEAAQLYYSAFVPDEVMPALFVAAAGGSFIPAWAQNSNLPVIGTGTY